MVYRLLTTGSVEIDMMEKQVSRHSNNNKNENENIANGPET